jgi:hypothetical protein
MQVRSAHPYGLDPKQNLARGELRVWNIADDHFGDILEDGSFHKCS